jgi:hypothetical protein
VIERPECEAGAAGAKELGQRLDLVLGDRQPLLRPDEPREDLAGAGLDQAAGGLDLRVAAAVAEDHPPGVAVLGDIGEPDLEDRLDPRLRRQVRGDPLEEARQVPPVALDQLQIERPLRVIVAVEHRLGHVRGGGDLIEGGPRVAPLAEQLPGRLFDHGLALAARHPLPLWIGGRRHRRLC